MPRRDQTGPKGEGPQTGRGLGDCAGENAPGRQFGGGMSRRRQRGGGFGRGSGGGFGGGSGRGYAGGVRSDEPESGRDTEYSPAMQLDSFKNDIARLKADLNDLLRRLERQSPDESESNTQE